MTPVPNRLDGRDLGEIETRVRQLCRKWGCPKQDQDDVVQEVFLAMMESDISLPGATAIVLHRLRLPQPHPPAETVPDRSPDPAEEALDSEASRELLARLTPGEREVVRLVDEGYTQREIARRLGLTFQGVGRRLEQLRKRLKSTSKGM